MTLVTAGEGAGLLPPDRVPPPDSQPELLDTTSTVYKNGYVLHNMDFSKLGSFEESKYFVTNDGEPASFSLKEGKLAVQTGDVPVKMLFTGNQLPKRITAYTVEIKLRFAAESKYLVYLHGESITADGKTAEGADNTALRYNGAVDNATHISKYDVPQTTVAQKLQDGEWVTLSCSAIGRELLTVTVSDGSNTVKWTKQAAMSVADNSYMGLMFGAESSVEIASIRILAGYQSDIKTPIWPGEAEALVQTVTSDAVRPKESVTEAVTAQLEADAPVTEPAVTAADTKPTSSAAASEEGGCGSRLSFSAGILWSLPALAVLLRKKEA